jgi:ABC-type transport system involved in cytochrome c biogenesis permease subunit
MRCDVFNARPIAVLLVMLAALLAPAVQAETAPLAGKVDLAPLQSLSVQHDQTKKTWDSWSRQTLNLIAGRSSLDGQPALFTVLDISFRPEAYRDRPLIRIKHIPLRQDIAAMPGLDPAESTRIMQEGTVSLGFWRDPATLAYLQNVAARSMHKIDAINTVEAGAQTLEQLLRPEADLPTIQMLPPVLPSDTTWKTLGQAVALAGEQKYDAARLGPVADHAIHLLLAWREADAAQVQQRVDGLAAALPSVVPDRYPSAVKRRAEVAYNGLYKLTLPGAAAYFFAFVFFVMAAIVGSNKLRWTGLALFILGFAIHTAGIGIRWWLMEKSTQSWFYAIPIKNQFESVMMSAWFGALAGMALELWKRKSIFGAASSFVGWFSLIAIFTVPYVIGVNIGNEIGQAAGILMSYWLYIHVTLAVASYALIGMSFLLGVWWLVYRIMHRGSNSPFAQLLDQCNLVSLQMAFWVLGVAIVFGAIWADVSWGRPWGWDPKETFALVTWICYLVIIHIRLISKGQRELWTAILSVIGFFVMLFNWIGVNYFLVGLHSYA